MLYTSKQIKDYCEDHTRFAKGFTGTEQMDVLNALASEIAAMPLHRQVLLIEGKGKQFIHKGADGFCCDKTLQIEWGINSFGKYGLNSFHHEDAHRVDLMLHGHGDSFSNICPIWQSLIDKRFKAQSVSDKFSYHACSKLYYDSKGLENHMAGGYPYDDYDIESFAEVSTHYTCLYRDLNGDHAQIDEKLSADYPLLWPYYRDIAIPAMISLARQLSPKYDAYIQNINKPLQNRSPLNRRFL